VIAASLLAMLITPAPAVAANAAGFEITYPKQRLPAPGFSLPDLTTATVSTGDFPGKVVLVHFWATFCVPCVGEMPELELLWQEYREQGLVVLGIAADRGDERLVHEFAEKAGLTFPVLLDPDGRVRNAYEVVALPMSYLIGRDGRISARAIGSREWNGPGGRELIETQLDLAAGQ
jgi:peroxiredoxin